MKPLLACIVAVLLLLTVLGASSTAQVLSARQESRVRLIVTVDRGVFDRGCVDRLGGRVVAELELVPVVIVELPSSAVNAFKGSPGLLMVESDGVVYAAPGRGRPPPQTTQPSQVIPWGMVRIGAVTAWNYTVGYADVDGDGDSEVEVAIIDTGVDADHPDLAGNIKWGVSVLNGRVRTNPVFWTDRNGHGTHVAGIVAAIDNSIGVVGAAPKVELYIVKALSDAGTGTWSDLILAIEVALKGPDGILDSDGDGVIAGDPDDDAPEVISMSLSGSSPPAALHDIIAVAYSYNVTLVAAAGNEGASEPGYPALYPEVIAVGAIDSNDTVPSWSNRLPEIVAPGVSVLSTYPDDTYAELSGTSMSTPHVSGVVALIQAYRLMSGLNILPPGGSQDLTNASVRGILHVTADDLGASGYDELYGYGVVRADLAVELSVP